MFFNAWVSEHDADHMIWSSHTLLVTFVSKEVAKSK